MQGLYLRGRIWWFRYSKDGVQRFESLGTEDESKAILLAETIRAAPLLTNSEKWDSDVQKHCAEGKASGNLSAGNARNRKLCLLSEGKRMGWRNVQQLTTPTLQAWFDALRKRRCDSTALTYLTHLRSFLNWAAGEGKLRLNPAEGVERRRAHYKARTNFASAETARKLIDAAKGPLKLAVMLGFLCGLRRREIMHARRDWLEGDALRVKKSPGFSPKCGRERLVPVPNEILLELGELGSELVVPPKRSAANPSKKFLVGHGARQWDFKKPWLDLLTACGVSGLTIHDMRRTFAVHKVSAGVPIYVVAKWLGNSITVCERNYAHLSPDVQGYVERGLV